MKKNSDKDKAKKISKSKLNKISGGNKVTIVRTPIISTPVENHPGPKPPLDWENNKIEW